MSLVILVQTGPGALLNPMTGSGGDRPPFPRIDAGEPAEVLDVVGGDRHGVTQAADGEALTCHDAIGVEFQVIGGRTAVLTHEGPEAGGVIQGGDADGDEAEPRPQGV